MEYLSSITIKLTRTFITYLILFFLLLAFSMILHYKPSNVQGMMGFAALTLNGTAFPNVTLIGSTVPDKLLEGLLATGFDEDSCLSRYQSSLYRKPSPYKPSPYLISKLRNYETLHNRCGPGTESYKEAVKQLDKEYVDDGYGGCKYVVLVPLSGLGNIILSLASVFLYALLTDRVLLVDRGKDLDDLFCEPFPGTSWLLPLDFQLRDQLNGLNQNSYNCYGYLLKNEAIVKEKTLSHSHLYLHLLHNYGDHDKMFFCQRDQQLIRKVPWLIFKTNLYIVPSLWLISGFEDELNKLFPEKATVFHHLSRYLFHPTNQVWGLVTRYYQSYLANADEKIGIQVRVFDMNTAPFEVVMDQILACARKEKLLPQVNTTLGGERSQAGTPRIKAVIVTSLNSGYSEKLKSMYWEYPTSSGDIIRVNQPSQEGHQHTGKKMHDRKALAEIYLLSMTDNLVTSGRSTFGYVAQGLGGLKPWILYKPKNRTAPDRSMSMEPCFHSPPRYGCNDKTTIDTGKLVPHVRHCEDMSWGIKLV